MVSWDEHETKCFVVSFWNLLSEAILMSNHNYVLVQQ